MAAEETWPETPCSDGWALSQRGLIGGGKSGLIGGGKSGWLVVPGGWLPPIRPASSGQPSCSSRTGRKLIWSSGSAKKGRSELTNYTFYFAQAAQENCNSSHCLETDCQVLVQLWEKRYSQRSEIEPLLHRLDELSRSFVEYKLNFVSRNYNKRAHECPKLVSHKSITLWWASGS